MIGNLNVLGCKLETNRGTAETIAAEDCDLLVSDLEFSFEPTSLETNPVMPSFGTYENIAGGTQGSVTFKVPFRASGARGIAPAIGKLFKACGMEETVENGRVKYSPTSTLPTQTITLKAFPGIVKSRTLKGCVGTFTFDAKGNTPLMLDFAFTGVYESDGDETAPSPIYDNTARILPYLKACTNLLEYHEESNRNLTNEGTGYTLRDTNYTEIAFPLSNAEACELKRIRVHMTREGNPADFTNGVWLIVSPDDGGEPNRSIATATSGYVNPETISDEGDWTSFYFNTVGQLSVADYWVRVVGDFTESDTDNIVITTTSAPSGGCFRWDGAEWDAGIELVASAIEVAPLANIKTDGFSFDYGNTVNLQQDVCTDEGWLSAFVSGRACTGSIEPEEELSADRDYFSYVRSATKLSLSFKIGEDEGQIIEFNAPNTQPISGGSLGNRDDLMTSPLDLRINNGIPTTSGNDDIEILFF